MRLAPCLKLRRKAGISGLVGEILDHALANDRVIAVEQANGARDVAGLWVTSLTLRCRLHRQHDQRLLGAEYSENGLDGGAAPPRDLVEREVVPEPLAMNFDRRLEYACLGVSRLGGPGRHGEGAGRRVHISDEKDEYNIMSIRLI